MKTILKGRQVSSQGQWKTITGKAAVEIVQQGTEISFKLSYVTKLFLTFIILPKTDAYF